MALALSKPGIAVLSAEGKGNLDKPYAIFRALGIPVYVLWDCDNGAKASDAALNKALLRLVRPVENLQEAAATDYIGEHYAHFANTLETVMKNELTGAIHAECLASACQPFGLTPSESNHKIPEVMFQTLLAAKALGAECATLNALMGAVWQHLVGVEIGQNHPEAHAASTY